MPSSDISKCGDHQNCQKKETCWRFLAPAKTWQSYMMPNLDEDKNCLSYWYYEKDDPIDGMKLARASI